jgi:ADP-ribose pyrophosphatase YjhB (NUDIX family)
MKKTQKVYAYITRAEQLLVFSHADFPEAGIQVPGGTLEPGELPESGVLREAFEETGLGELHLAAYLGCDEFQMRESNPGEHQQRHFYHLRCTEDAPENWQHYESHPSDRSQAPILFNFYWLPAGEAGKVLHPYYTARLGELLDSLTGNS